jgi:tetratricopeptide (TPR) repeat protein
VFVCVLDRAPLLAAPCATSSIDPAVLDPVFVYAAGRAYARDGHYENARAMYRWLLRRDPADREARLALSRVDAWDGCFDRAESEYRALLRERPHDVEARAALIDVLLWTNRWIGARRELDLGLALDPKSPELWRRRSQLLRFTGDRAGAVAAADRAEALEPGDTEISALRDRLYVGQLRSSGRFEFFPHGYPNLYTATLQAQAYLDRFELGAEVRVLDREGGVEREPVVDGQYTANAVYHANGGTSVGLGLGFGAPARSIPTFATKAWFVMQLASRWSTYFAYAFWVYRNDKTIHIFAPALSYVLTDMLRLELRWWTSYQVLPRPMASATTGWIHAVSVAGIWQILPRVSAGVSYTYGPQLDQTPTNSEFFTLTSHVFGVFADWLVQREWGISPGLSFERRESENGAVALAYSGELALYIRW